MDEKETEENDDKMQHMNDTNEILKNKNYIINGKENKEREDILNINHSELIKPNEITTDYTNRSDSTEIIYWLKANNLNDNKLIEELTNEEIETVNDLLIFKEEQLKERLLLSKRSIKIGIICKLMKELQKQRNNNNTSIIISDKTEKEAIEKLKCQMIEVKQKIESLPKQRAELSAATERFKIKIYEICDQWIDKIEQKELNKYEQINKELNNHLNVLTETKLKCKNAIFDHIYENNSHNVSKDNIVTLVNNCMLQINEPILILSETNNIFNTFDVNEIKNLLSEWNNKRLLINKNAMDNDNSDPFDWNKNNFSWGNSNDTTKPFPFSYTRNVAQESFKNESPINFGNTIDWVNTWKHNNNSNNNNSFTNATTTVENGKKNKNESDYKDNGIGNTFASIVQLEETEVDTAHENETLIISIHFAKLYRWGKDVSNELYWKIRATDSNICFYKSNINNKIRTIAREHITNKLRMNQFVPQQSNASFYLKKTNVYSWIARDASIAAETKSENDNTGYSTWCIKFENIIDANQFETHFKNAMENNKQPLPIKQQNDKQEIQAQVQKNPNEINKEFEETYKGCTSEENAKQNEERCNLFLNDNGNTQSVNPELKTESVQNLFADYKFDGGTSEKDLNNETVVFGTDNNNENNNDSSNITTRDNTEIDTTNDKKLIMKSERNSVELCRNYPDCEYGRSCWFYHPSKQEYRELMEDKLCWSYPNCNYGEKCRFIHISSDDSSDYSH